MAVKDYEEIRAPLEFNGLFKIRLNRNHDSNISTECYLSTGTMNEKSILFQRDQTDRDIRQKSIFLNEIFVRVRLNHSCMSRIRVNSDSMYKLIILRRRKLMKRNISK